MTNQWTCGLTRTQSVVNADDRFTPTCVGQMASTTGRSIAGWYHMAGWRTLQRGAVYLRYSVWYPGRPTQYCLNTPISPESIWLKKSRCARTKAHVRHNVDSIRWWSTYAFGDTWSYKCCLYHETLCIQRYSRQTSWYGCHGKLDLTSKPSTPSGVDGQFACERWYFSVFQPSIIWVTVNCAVKAKMNDIIW